jgi:hypothetical protein
MKNIILKITGLTLALMMIFGINSCVKDDFDQPPVLDIPVGDMKAIEEIQTLASLHDDAAPLKITEDMSIAGLITMGEQSGNLYKQVIIEDVTGGIMLNFTGSTSLHVGDSVRVNLNGAKVYNYNGLNQIDSLDVTYNVMKISAGNTVVLPELTLPEIDGSVGRVAKIVDVQFVESQLGSIFAAEGVSENRNIEGCAGGATIVRTSGYANFASETLPEGSGSMVAFISFFGSAPQLIIRSYEELEMDNDRCSIIAPETNSSIKEIKALYQGERLEITDSLVFEATVIANDKTGNYYKTIVVQDDERGLEIKINDYDLFELYEVGQKIVVSTKGLYLDTYGGIVQLGSIYEQSGEWLFGGIAEGQSPNYITPVSGGSEPTPEVLSISEMSDEKLGMLLELQSVQFVESELGETYADAAAQYSANRTLTDCDGNRITVRTSGYADFAGETIAEGNGSFVGVLSAYNGTYQLYIRDLVDLDLNGERCEVGGGGGSWTPNTTIPELKQLYTGARVQITDELVLEATVTANDKTGNYYKTIVIQDDEGGIEMKINDYDLFQTFAVGQKIHVNCQDLYLDTYGGVIQLGSVYESGGSQNFGGIEPGALFSHVELVSGGVELNPTNVSITNISDDHLGMLLEIDGVQFIDSELGETYADAQNLYSANRTLEDCDGNNITVRTSGYADFADENIAEGNGTFVGVLGAYDGTYQLWIRDLVDLDLTGERCDGSGGGGGGGSVEPVDEVDENFNSLADYDDVELEGWTNIVVEGDRAWIARMYDNDLYAQTSGYNSGLDLMETWLITPPVTNIEDKKLSFRSAIAYWAHGSGHPGAVLISEDFVGDNFETATWTELNVTIAQEADGDNVWVESGEYDLSAFSGNAAIAFRYIGSATESTTFRVDDVLITDGSGGGGGGGSTVESVNEDFESQTNYEDVALDGWVNINVEGDRMWQAKEFDNDLYAQATGYNSGLDNMECWLITPVVSDIGSKSLSLRTAMAYWAHGSNSPLIVLVSTDYDGENYATATWEEIDITLANQSSGDHEWVNSGSYDLSNFDGDGAVAFKYVGSATESTSFRLDDIVIE